MSPKIKLSWFSGFLLSVNLCFGEFASQLTKDDIRIKFEEFKFNFSKVYKNQFEEDRRFEIFKSKLLSIEQHNARTDVSFKKGETLHFKYFWQELCWVCFLLTDIESR